MVSNSLSPQEIADIVGKNVTMISNAKSDLKELYNRLRSKTKAPSRYIIHYQTKHNGGIKVGHWCGIVIKGKQIWFYDPYGDYPDDQLTHINMKYRKSTKQSVRKLGKFLYKAYQLGYKIIWNENKHQVADPRVSTCGRWVGLFLSSGVSPDEFNKLVRDYKVNDMTITNATSKIIGH